MPTIRIQGLAIFAILDDSILFNSSISPPSEMQKVSPPPTRNGDYDQAV